MNIRELCLKLAKAESSDDVREILEKEGYWNDASLWRDYGDDASNSSIFINQQDSADGALVEKITNAVDALILRECWRREIDPESKSETPLTISDAAKEFFSIRGGTLESAWDSEIRELLDLISIVASGDKKNPCIHIIDKGIGQTPKSFPDTLMSLMRGNKNKIKFVQGQYNMGATGVVTFCGDEGIQLIISRRDPKVVEIENRLTAIGEKNADPTCDEWGFTVTRIFPPNEDEKNEVLKYLAPIGAPNGEVLKFPGNPLDLLPGKHPDAFGNPLEWGTFIKLYEYHSLGRNATDICRNLLRRLDFLLFGITLPAKLFERRNYRKDHYEASLNGLSVVLSRNRAETLEPGFPVSETISIDGNPIDFLIYVFKKESSIPYATREGVAFLLNGQVQGWLPRSLFAKAELAYIEKHLLVVADTSRLSQKVRRTMFMGSRDRIKKNELTAKMETEIIRMLKDQDEVLRINTERRKQQAENKRELNTVVIDQIKRLARINPNVKFLLNPNLKIHIPFDERETKGVEEYKGSEFPHYFNLASNSHREMPRNHEARIFYETDAANDYFARFDSSRKGYSSLEIVNLEKDEPLPFHRIGLNNGQATLRFRLPESVVEGDKLTFRLRVYDRENEFIPDDFTIIVRSPQQPRKGGKSSRRKPPDDDEGEDTKKTDAYDPPQIIAIYRKDWNTWDESWTDYSALRAMASGEGGYDIYLNMDNIFLKQEIKRRGKKIPVELQVQWESFMTLLAMAILSKNTRLGLKLGQNDDILRPELLLRHVSRLLAPLAISIVNDIM
ncbi:MAG: hypothetical protein KAU48_09675 [Candidatus Thorarchaeota archaeon]|nr:hypothetical protein [Candidatus Thorarchaeota archaeon]